MGGAELDGDGDRDLVLANGSSNTITVMWNLGEMGFEVAASYVVGTSPADIKAVDDDGDGDIDLNTHHPEFEAWKWLAPDDLTRLIIPFKRRLYDDSFTEFRGVLEGSQRK